MAKQKKKKDRVFLVTIAAKVVIPSTTEIEQFQGVRVTAANLKENNSYIREDIERQFNDDAAYVSGRLGVNVTEVK